METVSRPLHVEKDVYTGALLIRAVHRVRRNLLAPVKYVTCYALREELLEDLYSAGGSQAVSDAVATVAQLAYESLEPDRLDALTPVGVGELVRPQMLEPSFWAGADVVPEEEAAKLGIGAIELLHRPSFFLVGDHRYQLAQDAAGRVSFIVSREPAVLRSTSPDGVVTEQRFGSIGDAMDAWRGSGGDSGYSLIK